MKTIVDFVDDNAARRGGELAFRYLETGDVDGPSTEIDCAALRARVQGVAAELARSFAPGERVMLLYPPGLDFIVGFFACLTAGVVAVPAFPPDLTALERSIARLKAIVGDCGASAVLTTSAVLELASGLLSFAPELGALRWIAADLLPVDDGAFAAWRPRLDPAAPAFLQYTSGSTGTPKGVVVTHDNLLHNQAIIRAFAAPPPHAHTVSWLPLYHDMGLIGTVLGPVFAGMGCTLMSPVAFLQRPARWLEALSTFRGTMSGAPSFAYELCTRKVGPEARARLDLSAWEIAFNGAEPVRAETLARFAEAFAVCGLRPHVVRPVYGLAESTLIVTGARKQSPAVTVRVDAAALERGQVTLARGDAPARELVGCGRPFGDHRVEIVDPTTRRRAAAGVVGEIWIAGPSVARGYWQRPEDTARDFDARIEGTREGSFLRTGDLGFVHEGELFIAGRSKDVIIVRGRNLHPHDLEMAAERAHPAVRPGCVAAFGAEEGGEEGVVVVAEIDERRAPDPAAVVSAIRAAITAEVGAGPQAIALLRARSLPKTTSGKVQRRACRELFLRGGLSLAAEIARLAPRERVAAAPGAAARALAALAPREREAALTTIVCAEIAALLGPSAIAITPDASLHGLGLDSLLRVELDHALDRALDVRLPAALAFEHATPRALARALLARLDDPSEAPALAPVAAPATEHRASANQALMWRLQQHAPGAYMHVYALSLRGDLGVETVRAALQAVVDRASIWRTTFHRDGAELRARVHAHLAVTVEIVDGAAFSDADFARQLEAESTRGIDPAVGPLLRGTLIRRAGDVAVLVLAFNHLAYDSTTLLATLDAILARLGGLPVKDDEALDFARYAAWEEALLASPEGELLRDHWRRALSREDLRLELPHDRPEHAPRTYACAAVSAPAPEGLLARLEALGRARGLTMNTILVTAYQATLHRETGRPIVVVGTAALTRLRPEHRRIAGPLFNHVPLVARFEEGTRWSELLARGQAAASEALAHQGYPFARLAGELGADTNRLGDAVFTLPAMCAYYRADELGAPGPRADLAAGGEATIGGLSARVLPIRTGTSATDYFLFATQQRGALGLDLWYARELIDPARAERLLARVIAALIELCDRTDQPLGGVAS
jgi:acyl-CoA synthetase (AMP-forming)/AMP-acid ligase II/acyl carrier protein